MNFKVTYKQLASDKVLMCVKNNMKSTFEDVKFTYTLRDASGAVVQKKEIIVSDILLGKTSYTTISTYELRWMHHSAVQKPAGTH